MPCEGEEDIDIEEFVVVVEVIEFVLLEDAVVVVVDVDVVKVVVAVNDDVFEIILSPISAISFSNAIVTNMQVNFLLYNK